jgi:RNA polymerase sigma-70 factor (ECF subfamily)
MSIEPAGQPDAFESLFRQHYARLCELVHGYVRARDTAEDIVQELFVTLLEKRDRVEAHELTTAYLYVAARNRALKHLRHARVVERHRTREAGNAATGAGDTDHRVREQEAARAVEAAIADLPERCREIFLLSRRQHMTYAEIAAALGISVKTVEVQMWRALQKLRRMLASFLG